MKRRQILAILMAVVMLLGMMPSALATIEAPAHTHDYAGYEPGREATCTEPGYHYEFCTICSRYGVWTQRQVTDPPKGHDFSQYRTISEATCTEGGQRMHYCSRCGATEIRYTLALGHNWGAWQTIQAATCTSSGSRQHVCERCGATETERIGALGHSYTTSTVLKEPTCSEPGQRQAKCTRCGETIIETIPTTAHTWGEEIITRDAGLWSVGLKARYCQVCGASETTEFYMDGTVLPGDKGDGVKKLQELLNAAGYDCGKADGIAGGKTDSAIKAAEAAAGAPQDGIGWVGLQQWLSGNGGPYPAGLAGEPFDNFVVWVEAPASSDAKVGEKIPTTVHIRNTGNTQLYIGGYYGGYCPGKGNTEKVDTETYGALGQTNLQPGEETTLVYNVTPTENDMAAGQAPRLFGVGCYRMENGDNVGENIHRDARFVIKLGETLMPAEPFDSYTLWVDAPTSSGAQAGEEIPTTVHLMNTGNTVLRFGGYYGGDFSDGKHTVVIESERYGGMSKFDLQPGDESVLNYYVTPTESDIAAGQAVRNFSTSCYRLENGEEVGDSLENDAAFVIALAIVPVSVTDPAPTAGAGISLVIESVDGQIFHVGDTVKATARVTNTGSNVLNVIGYTLEDSDGNDRLYEGVVERNETSEPVNPRALEPGQSYFVDFSIKATDEDGGIITRRLTAVALDDVGNEVSDGDETTLYMQSYTTPGTTTPMRKAGIDVWAEYDPTSSAGLGETIPVVVNVKNISEKTLRASYFQYRTAADGAVVPGEKFAGPLADGSGFISANTVGHIDYSVVVTQADLDAGQVRRYVLIGAVDENVNEYTPSYSDDEYITIDLVPGDAPQENAGIDVWAEYESTSSAGLGETIPVVVNVKNISERKLRVSYFQYRNAADGAVVPGETLAGPLYEGSGFISANAVEKIDYSVVVTQADLDAGQIRRYVYMGAVDEGVDEYAPSYGDEDYITIDLTGGTMDGSALMLNGMPQEYKTFYPEDTFTVDLTATNIGEHDLRGLTIDVSKADEYMSETKLGTAYSAGSTTVLPVGSSDGDSYTYTIKPEDAGHIVTLLFRAKAADTVTTELVKSSEYMVEFQVEGGEDDLSVDLYLEAGDYSGLVGSLGKTLEVPMTTTNKGTASVNMYGYSSHDGNGNFVNDDSFTDIDVGLLSPDESQRQIYQILVTQADIDYGKVVRKVKCVGSRVTGSEDGFLTYEKNEFGNQKDYWTNEVVIEIPLDETVTGDVDLYLEALDYSGLVGSLGKTLEVPLLTTNKGGSQMLVDMARHLDVDGNWTYSDKTDFGSGGNLLSPGDSMHTTYQILVTQADIDYGKIVRTFQHKGKRVIGAEDGHTAYEKDETGEEKYYETNWVDIEIPLDGNDTLDASLYIEQIGPETEVEAFSSYMIQIPIKVTNIGKVKLDTRYARSQDGDGNDTHLDADADSHMITSGSGFIAPGESFTEMYIIYVTPNDISKGLVERTFWNFGYPLVLGATAESYDETTEIPSNKLDFEFDLRETPEDASLFIEQSGPASPPDGALGEIIEVPIRYTNKGSIPLQVYQFHAAYTNNVWPENDDCYGGSDGYRLEQDESGNCVYEIGVTQKDIDDGIIRRRFYRIGNPWVSDGTGEFVDSTVEVNSNVLDIEIPLRDVPREGTGELTLEVTDVSKPAAALGEWVTATVKLTNTGDVNVFANNSADWNPHDAWQINSPYVSGVTGGTGISSPLEPGLYVTHDLSIYVTQEDVDAGQIEREIYFYGLKEGTDKNVVSNTEKITIRLLDRPDDDDYIDLELVAGPVTPVFAVVGDKVTAPMTLINNGTAPAKGKGHQRWYEDDTFAYPDTIEMTNFEYIDANGGTDEQIYTAVVTEDDVKKGVVRRYVQEYAHHWLLDTKTYETNKLMLEIPLMTESTLIPPVTIELEPDLVLTMTQTSPIQAVYKDGQEIEYDWTLTNVGEADCDFGGLKLYYTNKAGNMITADEAFYGLDGREVLAAKGGSKSGKGKLTLDAANILSDGMIVVDFYGQGYYPNTSNVWVKSNDVPFEYRIDDNIWTPEVKVELDKWEDSIRPYSEGYTTGNDVWYGWYVHIPDDVVLNNFTLEDPMFDDGHGGHVLFKNAVFGNEENTASGYYSHKVTLPEAQAGSITNTLTASWDDPVTGERVSTSDQVVVPTFEMVPPPPPVVIPTPGTLEIYKYVASAPWNGEYYQENEHIIYKIVVYNNSDQTMYDIYVDDPLMVGINKTIGYLATLAPYSSYAFLFAYIVTDKDCDVGHVINTATAYWTDSDGHGHSKTSEPTDSLTGRPEPPLSVVKKVTNTPKNGSFYQKDETIEYKIIVTNISDRLLTDVLTYDVATDRASVMLGSAELLHAGETRTYTYSVVVDQDDVDRGWVENFAVGFYTDGDNWGIIESNHVFSDTNGIDEEITETAGGFELPIPADDYCKLTLNGKGNGTGDYTRHICANHLATQSQIDALVSAAADADARAMAWKTARALWQTRIDEMYELLDSAAKDTPTRLIVLNERLMFNAQVSLEEEALTRRYPDDKETVAKEIAGMMREKCEAMCYELHTAPADRVDSVLNDHAALADAAEAEACARAILERTDSDTRFIETLCKDHASVDAKVLELIEAALKVETDQRSAALAQVWTQAKKLWLAQLDAGVNDRYRAADADGRKIVAAQRTGFGNWLHTREELLKLLYPENDATVDEVLSRTVMNRVIEACIADAEK